MVYMQAILDRTDMISWVAMLKQQLDGEQGKQK